MLDNLIESKKNSAENKRLGRYLLTTFVLVFSLALSGVLWSLFAKDFGMGSEDLELSNLVTPIPIIENKPEPEQIQKPEKTQQTSAVKEITRNDNILQMKESPSVPDKISVTPNTKLSRPDSPFKISPGPETTYQNTSNTGRETDENAAFSKPTESGKIEKPEITIPKPPPPIKKSEPEVTKKPPMISGGVVNGKATSLPKPAYPPPARAVGASGKVDVQVTIDENGSVVSAKAISGHPLLRDSAERAARSAKFSPTYLSKQPVKVSGLIVYNFTKN